MFREQSVKAEWKGDDEEGADDRELQEGLHHVGEHDDVHAEERKFSHVLKLKKNITTSEKIRNQKLNSN